MRKTFSDIRALCIVCGAKRLFVFTCCPTLRLYVGQTDATSGQFLGDILLSRSLCFCHCHNSNRELFCLDVSKVPTALKNLLEVCELFLSHV